MINRVEELHLNPFYFVINALLKRTNKGAGPSGRELISSQKEDSLLVLNKTGS